MHKPQKSKCRIGGLVAAGLVAVFCGLAQIMRPVAYFSSGGFGRTTVAYLTTVFSGDDARFTGVLILFTGGFILTVAYRIRNVRMHGRHKERHPESAVNTRSYTRSDTKGTPWEHDEDHTARQ